MRREDQPDANLLAIETHEHALVSKNRPTRCWLTYCSKPRAWSFQQQPGRANQMLTYILFKTQSMILSATPRKGQPDANLQTVQTQSMILSARMRKGQSDADLHPVQNQEHDLVSNNQDRPARCWLTSCSKPRECPYQQQPGRASQMLTYNLFKPRAYSCQQQPGRTSQMLTYNLFKTHSMLLSATSMKGQPNPGSPTIHNQCMFSSASSLNQLDIGLLSVQIYFPILKPDNQVKLTYHMWKTFQYFLNHLFLFFEYFSTWIYNSTILGNQQFSCIYLT